MEIDDIDPRVLSDGAIFGILEATEDTSLSISEARALEYDLELEENYFSVPGGDELEEAYEVLAYAYTQASDTPLRLEELNIAAIRGMVGALADPYTAYLSREDLRLEQSDLEGSFHGIGAYVGTNSEGYPIIISPMENSPAEAAGILAGDIILEIDGIEAKLHHPAGVDTTHPGAGGHACRTPDPAPAGGGPRASGHRARKYSNRQCQYGISRR